jgi:capsular polysaccharide export protein
MSAPLPKPQTVTSNPAFECLQQATSVLLLQGPVGPFFDRLALWLKARGKRVNRVVFQAGDAHDCQVLDPHAYRGTPQQWAQHLANLADQLAVDCIVLFGQSRHYHAVARAWAESAHIPVVVLEEGYFRPGYVTMELGGVNGYSQTLSRHHWQPSAQLPHGITPDISPWHFQKMAWFASCHYAALHLHSTDFPNYQHHRNANPYSYAAYWLRSWGIKWRKRTPDLRLQKQLLSSPGSYFLVPLQHDGDAQITHHSPYGQNTDFIINVLRSFALHAPSHRKLVFRQHPHSRGGPGHVALIQSLSKELGIGARVHHMVEGDTPDLAQHSAGVVLINSTVGLQALERGAPLIVLGDAVYKQPGLVHPGTLNDFWQHPKPPEPQRTAFFLAQIKNLTQMPCSVYAQRNEPLGW